MIHLGLGWEIHLSYELGVLQPEAPLGKLAKNCFFGDVAGRSVVGRPSRLRPTFAVTSSFGFEALFGLLEWNIKFYYGK